MADDGAKDLERNAVGVDPLKCTSMETHPGLTRRCSSLGTHQPHWGQTHWLAASGHLITICVGAGVLGLPHAVSWLGWVGGPLCMVGMAAITLWALWVLSECYVYKGVRNRTYKAAVLAIMGRRHQIVLATCQMTLMALASIGYTIITGIALTSVVNSLLGYEALQHWQSVLAFGIAQLMLSQMPTLESATWAADVGAIMSIGYCLIALGLAASHAGAGQGTVLGNEASPEVKTMSVFNSIGAIAFAYGTSVILLEVQDTLKEPPAAAVSMKKAIVLSTVVAAGFYVSIGVLGYAALGSATPDDILEGFVKSAPVWVSALAHIMVIVHMLPSYQVMSQPMFMAIEDGLIAAWPRIDNAPILPVRMLYRSTYVAITTVVAIVLPSFASLVGLVGAMAFAPLTVIYPFSMYMIAHPYKGTGRDWNKYAMLLTMVVVTAISMCAVVGSVYGIVQTAASMKPFTT